MAREILFKAKRIDNGEWVEGLIWKKKYNTDKIFISCFPNKDDDEEVFVVDSETICQYTGLTDKNGNKIWENDILSDDDMVSVVRWDEEENRIDLDISYAEKNEQVAKWLKELKAYRDAEEQGLLLRLPCKVGDTVYALTPFCEICEEALDNPYACEICSKGNFITETRFDYEMIRMLGKTVFLTKEEAEKKLESMQKGE